MDRRTFLTAAGLVLAAPAIVRVSSIMPVRSYAAEGRVRTLEVVGRYVIGIAVNSGGPGDEVDVAVTTLEPLAQHIVGLTPTNVCAGEIVSVDEHGLVRRYAPPPLAPTSLEIG